VIGDGTVSSLVTTIRNLPSGATSYIALERNPPMPTFPPTAIRIGKSATGAPGANVPVCSKPCRHGHKLIIEG
jgi:hypothetical protein